MIIIFSSNDLFSKEPNGLFIEVKTDIVKNPSIKNQIDIKKSVLLYKDSQVNIVTQKHFRK